MDHPAQSDSAALPDSAADLPYLTADLPGVGGAIKRQPEDFEVEEIAAYEPSGDGEHLFLWIEKRDVPADELLRHVARRLAISPGDVGMAGLKDRRAVTRQWISIPARCEPSVPDIEDAGIRVVRAARHPNKLRTGHLRGNRFSIIVRDVAAIDLAGRAGRIAEAVGRLGFPNYFGSQRFGRDGQTLRLGLDLIRGQASTRSIRPSQRRFWLRMSLSAVQSALFNAVLTARIRDGLLHTVLNGDVMQVMGSGGQFVVDDAAAEQRRFEARETVVTGPIFGPKMRSPQADAGVRERDLLAAWDLCDADFERFPKLTSGTRRPFLVWPDRLVVCPEGDTLRLKFDLPSGAYATMLLREFTKLPVVGDEGERV